MKIANDIAYVGVNDHDIDLFEGQYIVPNGMSYNSYLITDDKTVLLDTVDRRKSAEFIANLKAALGDRALDYIIISHVEPDHASALSDVLEIYPDAKLIGNAKTFQMLALYTTLKPEIFVTVKEGDTFETGHHTLSFYTAPMVHWPEVMFTYDSSTQTLFSADAFGKFGALDADEDWACEARRYYFNIVGKFGVQVQGALKKAANLTIKTICPLHGPVLTETIPEVLRLYQIWSSYGVESEGVFIAYASIHGNTANAVEKLAELLKSKGCPKVAVTDLARCDIAEALEDAFRYGKIVLAASSYNGGVMPFMEDFLNHLKAKNYQKRTVGLIENGSWAPSANRTMNELISGMKEMTVAEPSVTIRGAFKESDIPALTALADAMLA